MGWHNTETSEKVSSRSTGTRASYIVPIGLVTSSRRLHVVAAAAAAALITAGFVANGDAQEGEGVERPKKKKKNK